MCPQIPYLPASISKKLSKSDGYLLVHSCVVEANLLSQGLKQSVRHKSIAIWSKDTQAIICVNRRMRLCWNYSSSCECKRPS